MVEADGGPARPAVVFQLVNLPQALSSALGKGPAEPGRTDPRASGSCGHPIPHQCGCGVSFSRCEQPARKDERSWLLPHLLQFIVNGAGIATCEWMTAVTTALINVRPMKMEQNTDAVIRNLTARMSPPPTDARTYP